MIPIQHSSSLSLGLLSCLLVTGCGDDSRYSVEELGEQVSFVCPGDPSGVCDFSDELELRAGAAAVNITPDAYETWVDEDGNGHYSSAIDTYLDCGHDRLCAGDEGYPGPDEGEGDNQFAALWLAGFGNARPMQAVADAIWARATVLEQGNTKIGVVSVDLVGFFYHEVQRVREEARKQLDLDHVIVSATHVHEAPDTMGQWGPNIARTGVAPRFMEQVHAGIQSALRTAVETAVPAQVSGGSYTIPPSAWTGTGINNINRDHRDPQITDDTIWTAHFAAVDSGETLATWINFPNHPEASGSRNALLTSDFAHTLRETVEQGAPAGPDGPMEGLGGVAIYIQGACGGMMTPLSVATEDLDGAIYSDAGIEKAYAVGRVTGYHALQAVAGQTPNESTRLSVRAKQVFVPVENTAFHVLLNAGVFDRPAYNYNEGELFGYRNQPDLLTEVSILEVGDVAALTVPGELLPELAIGGYDGEHTGPLDVLVDPSNPNPPRIEEAPDGPYLRERTPGKTKMFFGLANDEIGYLIPDYNYVLHPTNPYLNEADGDHYEETNSVGESGSSVVLGALGDLIEWSPPETAASTP
jgi:hypothetical protein